MNFKNPLFLVEKNLSRKIGTPRPGLEPGSKAPQASRMSTTPPGREVGKFTFRNCRVPLKRLLMDPPAPARVPMKRPTGFIHEGREARAGGNQGMNRKPVVFRETIVSVSCPCKHTWTMNRERLKWPIACPSCGKEYTKMREWRAT